MIEYKNSNLSNIVIGDKLYHKEYGKCKVFGYSITKHKYILYEVKFESIEYNCYVYENGVIYQSNDEHVKDTHLEREPKLFVLPPYDIKEYLYGLIYIIELNNNRFIYLKDDKWNCDKCAIDCTVVTSYVQCKDVCATPRKELGDGMFFRIVTNNETKLLKDDHTKE